MRRAAHLARCRAGRLPLWIACCAIVAACRNESPPEAAAEPPASPAQTSADFSAAGLQADEVASFLRTLQRAVASDDRAAVASLASYPLRATAGGEPRSFGDADAFTMAYPTIVTEAVKSAVSSATVESLSASSRGVRIGRGEVWFGGVYPEGSSRYVLMILSINGG